ncbi:hypothetical protein ACFWPA_03265 [Rhodococcus sp. NPDC058505]|uniref:hypothetical protein n=1 Tax=unclassified Rhodococcus (in: high G+C Gram-positive bacteria) TaxID=192944 RepID=UPI00364FF2BA
MTITDSAPGAHPGRDPNVRARLARIFGDVLPDTTRDERGESDGTAGASEGSSDEWLRRQVPPHHG